MTPLPQCLAGKLVRNLCVFAACIQLVRAGSFLSSDDLDNHISPEDLEALSDLENQTPVTNPDLVSRYWDEEDDDWLFAQAAPPVPDKVDCFGVGPLGASMRFLFNLRPGSSKTVNVHYYFSSRKQPQRVQVFPGDQFGLEWVDFDPHRRTVIIIHGFMSHSNASWVRQMSKAFVDWQDSNVVAVDWSGGGNTWKYWRAVANTRRVGADVTQFLRQLMNATGCATKDFHLVGHSLGAHIASYVAAHLGGVTRITGLDPAQPCFMTTDRSVLLDRTDAEFVDVIHTNGRLLSRFGLGLPNPSGHADFYPNGGMKQPGCANSTSFFRKLLPSSISRITQAICSHGRAYLYFTESILNKNCTFIAHRWNMTYEGVNGSIAAACDRGASCSEMGIRAIGVDGVPKARGAYFALTTPTQPYCPTEDQLRRPDPVLLRDLRRGFRLDRSLVEPVTPSLKELKEQDGSVYADPVPPTTRTSQQAQVNKSTPFIVAAFLYPAEPKVPNLDSGNANFALNNTAIGSPTVKVKKWWHFWRK